MSKVYNYALSIDLGISSIGTALLQINENGDAAKVLDAGVRTFEIPLGGADRRGARQTRNTLEHRKNRLRKLKHLLQENNILPNNKEDYKKLISCSPYRLRAYGAKNAFDNLHELGRCLMHMAKFRGAGFLGQLEDENDVDIQNSTTNSEKSKTPKTEGFYRSLERIVSSEKITLGEFFFRRLIKKENSERCIRRRKRFIEQKLVDYAVPRFLVKNDFTAIWERQKEHYKLTDSLKEEVSKIIFDEKGHAPYANGVCSLDPDSMEVRLPKMHRLAEEKRIYEQVNNLRYQTSISENSLTKDMRDALINYAMSGEVLTKSFVKEQIQKYTDEKITRINMEGETSKIKPLSHIAAFASIPHWKKLSDAEKDNLLEFIAEPKVNNIDPHARLMPEEDFLQECIKRLHIADEKAFDIIAKCISLLPKDRTALGRTATTRILQKLKDGTCSTKDDYSTWLPLSFTESAKQCGYKAEEEKHREQAETKDELPYYGEVLRHDVTPVHPWHVKQANELEVKFGRIPNPVVHVALNQLRKVVNEVIFLYGKPKRIHIELAREFGLSAKKRDEIFREQQERAKENEKINEELQKLGLSTTRKNRTKYRLWKEQGQNDIYTLNPIQASEFDNCEIDHIIPQAIGGTDTFVNLALTKVNSEKSNAYAYDFIQIYSPDKWQHIFKFISGNNYPPAKKWRFLESAKNRFETMGDEEQTDHRMNDTSYIGKMAKRYLSVICTDIISIRGVITARMRHLWGLDGLEYELMDLPIYRELRDDSGQILYGDNNYPLPNPAWKAKPRIDHRHHALDAIVLGCIRRNMVQALTRAERRGEKIKDYPPPFGVTTADFRQYVLEVLQKIKVSPKAEHGLEGQLHDATKYRIICNLEKDKGKYVITYQREFTNVKSKKDVENIVFALSQSFPKDKPIILNLHDKCIWQRDRIQSFYPQAEIDLQNINKQRHANGEKETRITDEAIVLQAIKLAQADKNKSIGFTYQTVDVKTLVATCDKRECGFEPKNNFRVDFYVTHDGKIGWECITRFHANQKNFIPQWTTNNYKLLWSLWKGDVLELTIDADFKAKYKIPVSVGTHLFKVQKFSNNVMQINLLNDARALKEIDFQKRWVSGEKGLSFYTQSFARKVELTFFGKVYHKHSKLWHGKKKTVTK